MSLVDSSSTNIVVSDSSAGDVTCCNATTPRTRELETLNSALKTVERTPVIAIVAH